MASGGKKKTTMAKLDRERRMRERRLDKQARKDARKQASAHAANASETGHQADEAGAPDAPHPALQAAGRIPADG